MEIDLISGGGGKPSLPNKNGKKINLIFFLKKIKGKKKEKKKLGNE
jgi:hypothetical protein